jgi:NAD+ kinase
MKHGGHIYLAEGLRDDISLDGIHYYDGSLPDGAEMILVIGGDGSVLDAAVYAIGADLPLLGLNLGRLGYLAELSMDEISSLHRLISDDFEIREHITFAVSLIRGGEEMHLVRYAVNDVVISQGESEGLSEILLGDGVGNHFSYLADGIIVATPLGSTAYSLAAGGAIVDPRLNCLCVTPICPHSLYARPLIFPDSASIEIKNICPREKTLFLTVDGRVNYELSLGERIRVTRSPLHTKFVRIKDDSFYDRLRQKMNDNR